MSNSTDNLIYDIAFSMDESLTPFEKNALLSKYGESREILKLSKSTLKNILGRRWTGTRYHPEQFIERARRMYPYMEKAGICMVRYDSKLYPRGLREIPDYPFLLYYRGDISYCYDKSIALVGTRQPNQAGIERAKRYTSYLTHFDYTIISGLALGIDSLSHRTCLENRGKTIAVLGCGIDRIYPAGNKTLAGQILHSGGAIVSEYPPGFAPKKWYFPKRNRIIVGLSKSVLIVQSPERSGSLISAMLCSDYNRDLYAAAPERDEKSGAINPKDEGNAGLILMGASQLTVPENFTIPYPPASTDRRIKEQFHIFMSSSQYCGYTQ